MPEVPGYARIGVKTGIARETLSVWRRTGPVTRTRRGYKAVVQVPGVRTAYTCGHVHTKGKGAMECGMRLARVLSKETGIPILESLVKAEREAKARKARDRERRIREMERAR